MHLICFGSNVSGGQSVDSAEKFIFAVNPDVPKRIAHPTIEPSCEFTGPTNLVFANAALAFVYPHRTPMPKNRQIIVGRYILFISRMTNLMDDGIDRIERIRFVIACRDTHVAARPFAEGMHRLINAATCHVIPKACGKIIHQIDLRRLVKMARQFWRGRCRHDRSTQIDQTGAQLRKHLINHCAFRIRFIIAEQRII